MCRYIQLIQRQLNDEQDVKVIVDSNAKSNKQASIQLLLPSLVVINPSQGQPGLTAKRIIKCISERLKGYDPDRWEGVPFSFNTNWRDEAGYLDVETSIQVHEALEREFGIEIKDRHILISDVQTAYYIVNQSHDAV